MTARTAMMFVNIPTRNLDRAVRFFRTLGFGFNAQFTDDHAACMVLSDQGFVMILSETRFKDFARRPIADETTHTAHMLAISAASRQDVDHVADTAIASGGAFAAEPMDYGFMYQRSFYDPDGHHWEVIWMDPAHVQPPSDPAGS